MAIEDVILAVFGESEEEGNDSGESEEEGSDNIDTTSDTESGFSLKDMLPPSETHKNSSNMTYFFLSENP